MLRQTRPRQTAGISPSASALCSLSPPTYPRPDTCRHLRVHSPLNIGPSGALGLILCSSHIHGTSFTTALGQSFHHPSFPRFSALIRSQAYQHHTPRGPRLGDSRRSLSSRCCPTPWGVRRFGALPSTHGTFRSSSPASSSVIDQQQSPIMYHTF